MKRIGILVLVLGLFGCETGDRDNKLALSTLLGLGAGGVIGWFGVGGDFGDRFIAATMLGGGTAVGAYYLADNLLPPDREKMESTAFNALNNAEIDETVAWGDEQAGAWGTFTPTRDFTSDDGLRCRDYTATINVRGRSDEISETACRIHDGAWRTVSI